MHEREEKLPAGAGSGGVQKMPYKYGPKKMPGEGIKTMPYKPKPGEKLPRKVEDYFKTERAVDKNSAMVGKARRESLLEKRKAKNRAKPSGPIVI